MLCWIAQDIQYVFNTVLTLIWRDILHLSYSVLLNCPAAHDGCIEAEMLGNTLQRGNIIMVAED